MPPIWEYSFLDCLSFFHGFDSVHGPESLSLPDLGSCTVKRAVAHIDIHAM